MGMFSEIATEGTIRAICEDIRKAILMSTNEYYQRGLRKAGLLALGHFEWDTPKWAEDYKKFFTSEA